MLPLANAPRDGSPFILIAEDGMECRCSFNVTHSQWVIEELEGGQAGRFHHSNLLAFRSWRPTNGDDARQKYDVEWRDGALPLDGPPHTESAITFHVELFDGSMTDCFYRPGKGWVTGSGNLHFHYVSPGMMRRWRPFSE